MHSIKLFSDIFVMSCLFIKKCDDEADEKNKIEIKNSVSISAEHFYQ